MKVSRRRLAIAAASLVLLAAGSAAAYLTLNRRDVTTTSKEAYRLYEKGLENEQKMYMREAVEAYAAALAKDPHFVMATLRLASAIQSRDPDRAKSLVESAARHKDEISERERLIVDISMVSRRHDYKELEAKVDTYLKRFPNEPEGYQWKAGLLQRAGKLEEAKKVFEQLLVVNPNYASAYNTLGYFAMGRGDYAKSEDYFKRYRFLAPDQANPFDSLGELYLNTGRYDEARASLKQALAVKPDFAASIAHLGTLLVCEGKFDEAAESYRQAALMADKPESHFEWDSDAVLSHLFSGKTDDAARELARVAEEVRRAPEPQRKAHETHVAFLDAAIAAAAGRAEETEKKLAHAEELARAEELAAKQTEPSGGEPNRKWAGARELIRGGLLRAQGKCTEATAEYAVALKLADEHDAKRRGSFDYFPTDEMVRVNAASCLVEAGSRDEAEKVLAKVLARNPRFQPALDAAARLGLAVPASVVATAKPAH